MFNLIGFGEHAGSGVPDIFKAWRDAGLAAPVIEEMFGGRTPDRTILTFPLDSNNLPIRQSSDSSDIGERHYINTGNKGITNEYKELTKRGN